MAIRVEIEGHGIAEFPDDTDQAVIDRVVKERIAEGQSEADYKVVTPGGVEESAAEAMYNAPGKLSAENLRAIIEEKNPSLRKQTADFLRPTLEGGGAVLGGLAGVPLAPGSLGTSVVGGAGLGYAIGKKAADLIEGKNAPLLDQFLAIPGDVATGATYELGGQLAAKGIGAATTGLARFLKAPPLTTKGATVAAGDVLESVYGSPSAQEAANITKAAELENRLGIPPLTGAQRSGSTNAAMFEQSMAGYRQVAEELATRETAARETALDRFRQTLGDGGSLPTTQADQVTGQNITDALDATLNQVKGAERAIWDEVPNYPMPTTNFAATATELTKTPMVESAQNAVRGVLGFAEQVPNTVQGMQSIERTISSEINKAARAGDNETKRALTLLKNSIKADFDAMSAAAEAGDVALHNGAVVYPSKIQGELNSIGERIAQEQATAKGAADVQAMQKALMARGIPAMRQTAEPERSFIERITREYQAKIGGEVPGLASTSTPQLDHLTGRAAQLNEVLANLQPADDVAGKYQAAKQFSKEQHFDRFGRGQTKQVLAEGDQFNGQRIPAEQVPGRFFSETGADDLIRAFGKDEAARQMQPHIVNDLISKTGTPDGGISVLRGMNWLNNNMAALQKLGLDREVKQIIKDQVPNEFRRMLSAKRVDRLTDNPYFTVQEVRNLLKDYGSTLKELYGKDSLQALRDYHNLVQTMSRNKNVTYSGNSATWEKFVNKPEATGSVGRRVVSAVTSAILTASGAGVGATIHGASGAVVGASVMGGTKAAYDVLQKHAQETTARLLKEAITNPETAQMLMKIARGAKVPPKEINSHLMTLGLIGVTQ